MDKEIVGLITSKDYRGLEMLIDVYGSAIVKTIRAVLNRSEERSYQKETENEVFYRIWKNIARFDPQKSSLKTWCLTITRNLSVDKKRSLIRNQQLRPIEEANALNTYDRPLEKEEFLDLLHTLNDEDQLIFLKYYYYQELPQTIAEDLQMPVTQVYNHLSRGRKKLKSKLQEEVMNHGESI